MDDLISRQGAVNALWEALYDYEDKMEKRFLDSEELDVNDWFSYRIFVQHMSDIDRQTILNMPSAQKTGKWIATEKGLFATAYECSKCKRRVIDDTGYDVAKDYPFCHCGAKMEAAQ